MSRIRRLANTYPQGLIIYNEGNGIMVCFLWFSFVMNGHILLQSSTWAKDAVVFCSWNYYSSMRRHNLLVYVTRKQIQLHNFLGQTKGTTRYLIGCWFSSRGFSCTLSIFVLSNFWINISWLSGCWSDDFKEQVRFFWLVDFDLLSGGDQNWFSW